MKENKDFALLQTKKKLTLIPIPPAPLKDLQELGKRLPQKSLKQFKKEIKIEALSEVTSNTLPLTPTFSWHLFKVCYWLNLHAFTEIFWAKNMRLLDSAF